MKKNKHFLILLAVFTIPFIYIFFHVVSLGRIYHYGDQAIEEFWLHNMPFRMFPLDGMYSRFGWRHPGPFLYYFTYPFYLIFGRDGRALILATIAQTYIFSVATLWIVNSIKKIYSYLLIVPLMLYFYFIPGHILGAWNPITGIFLLILFFAILFKFFFVIDNKKQAFIWLILLSICFSALVQVHVSFIIICSLALAYALFRAYKVHNTLCYKKLFFYNFIFWLPVIISNVLTLSTPKNNNFAQFLLYTIKNQNQKIPVVAIKAMLHVGDLIPLWSNESNNISDNYVKLSFPILLIIFVGIFIYKMFKKQTDTLFHLMISWFLIYLGGYLFITTSEYPINIYLLFFQIAMWIFSIMIISIFIYEEILKEKFSTLIMFITMVYLIGSLFFIIPKLQDYKSVGVDKDFTKKTVSNIEKVMKRNKNKKLILRVDGSSVFGAYHAAFVNEIERDGYILYFQKEDRLRYGEDNIVTYKKGVYFIDITKPVSQKIDNKCYLHSSIIKEYKINSDLAIHLVDSRNWKCKEVTE